MFSNQNVFYAWLKKYICIKIPVYTASSCKPCWKIDKNRFWSTKPRESSDLYSVEANTILENRLNLKNQYIHDKIGFISSSNMKRKTGEYISIKILISTPKKTTNLKIIKWARQNSSIWYSS